MNVVDLTDVQIMQLPDHCFGERYVCTTYYNENVAGYYADLSPIVLPPKCVLWGIYVWMGQIPHYLSYFRMSLGFVLPANVAAFLLEQPLIPDMGSPVVPIRGIYLPTAEQTWYMNLKQLIQSGGKSFLTMVEIPTNAQILISISAVFSPLPQRVPDWMISI